jgi:hypothetical protein
MPLITREPFEAVMTPARLELITDVGPPDCPMTAFPLTIANIIC